MTRPAACGPLYDAVCAYLDARDNGDDAQPPDFIVRLAMRNALASITGDADATVDGDDD